MLVESQSENRMNCRDFTVLYAFVRTETNICEII